MQEEGSTMWPVAFGLIYFTFFLDNVLLTVLVPIIPDWIRGESLTMWAAHDAPLAAFLNTTVRHIEPQSTGVGGSQAAVGLVLSTKALCQLASAAPAAAAVRRRGPAAVLRLGTLLLLLAALVFAAGSRWRARGGACAAAGAGRAAQGAGAALVSVAGLALAAAAAPAAGRHAALAALLGAVALGVLVGYPLGGVSYALWSRGAPFEIIAAALLASFVMQYKFLDREEFNRPCAASGAPQRWWGGWGGPERACAGAVLLTTSVGAALEPCLPLWIMDNFHTQRWVAGAVFLPDTVSYFISTVVCGRAARAVGAERLAVAGQAAAGGAALCVPLCVSAGALAVPQAVLGAGLGALDAALVPALVSRGGARGAALASAAAGAAAALGPAAGGALAALAGLGAVAAALGAANLLYALYLRRTLANYPLSDQWGAISPEQEPGEELPMASHPYEAFHSTDATP